MNSFPDTQAIFAQLAAVPSDGAVKTLIENHDAWTHNAAAAAALTAGLRARLAALPRSPAVQSRIAVQLQALKGLAVRLPAKLAPAM